MLRARLSEALKNALRAKDQITVATVRLILAAVKDRDITFRGSGKGECIADGEILPLLQTMIRQRRDSIELFEQGSRKDLADRERKEIEVIRSFLPAQLGDAEIAVATREVIDELHAEALKDMGRVMMTLKEKYAGKMDFGKASNVVRELLV
jgi:uncharacterized protein YqeY